MVGDSISPRPCENLSFQRAWRVSDCARGKVTRAADRGASSGIDCDLERYMGLLEVDRVELDGLWDVTRGLFAAIEVLCLNKSSYLWDVCDWRPYLWCRNDHPY